MAYDGNKPVTGGSLVAADMRENFRALKEDDIVDGITRSVIAGTGLSGGGRMNANRTINHNAHTGDVTGSTVLTIGNDKVTAAQLYAGKTMAPSVPATAILQAAADTERGTTSLSYTKLKEIKIPKGGTLYVYFEMYAGGGPNAYGRIYRNGIAVGTQRITGSSAPQPYGQLIAGWSENDLCQLYVHIEYGTATAFVLNFRIYASDFIVNID